MKARPRPIQELAGLEKKDLIRLGGAGSIGRLLEFQLRARLASSPVPDGLKPSKLDPMSIYDCALMTAESLFKVAGPQILCPQMQVISWRII